MSQKIITKAFVALFVVNSFIFLGQSMSHAIVALYADSFGVSYTLVGFVVSAFAYTALAFKLVSSPAIDAFNRKYVLTGAVLTLVAAFVLYAVAPTVEVVILARLVQGAAMAFTSTTCLAMAADILPANRISTGIGYFSLAQAICTAIGPYTGLALSASFGYRVTFALSGVLMAIGVAIVWLLIKESPRERRPFKVTLGNAFAREAALPCVVGMLLSIAFSNVNSFLALYAVEEGITDNVGLFFTVQALAMLVSRPLVGRLADTFGLTKIVLPSMVFFALSFVCIASANSLLLLLVGALALAFGYGASGPLLQAFCMRCVPPERRGAGGNTYYLGLDLGNLIGPVVAGQILSVAGYDAMWFSCIIPIAIAFAAVVVGRGFISEVEQS